MGAKPSGIYKKGEVTLEELIQDIKNQNTIKKVGSIHTFSGIVRASSKEGIPVKGMKIDAYQELATHRIQEICEAIKEMPGILDIRMVHFFGEFEVSEELVHVVVAASHREEGFKALRDAVGKYKHDIAVWKKEYFEDGTSEWVHQSE
ncbi:MAG: hypothetical protein EU544_02270 [Promethearchaeota archaeon]|nr:MAG: hypothetical protein EU544_02270 [Candidatus Lokiarchaeota archaeon]